MSSSQRKSSLDYLKIFSMCFVVVIHAGGFWIVQFERSFNWIIADIIDSFARFAVPCFVMCSGALFLDKKLDTKEEIVNFYKKYLPHYTMYVVASLVIGKTAQLIYNPNAPLLEGLFYNFYKGWAGIIWYFFMFLGLIVVTPILRQIVLNPYTTKVFIILWIIFSIIRSTVDHYLGLFSFYIYNMLYASFFVGYYVLGYCLSRIDIKWPLKKSLCGPAFLGFALSPQLQLIASYKTNFPVIIILERALLLLCLQFQFFYFSKKNSPSHPIKLFQYYLRAPCTST